MSIRSNLAAPGLLRERALSASDALVQWPGIPLLVKMVMGILLCLTLIMLGIIAVSRTGAIPKIPDPPQPYLPGNAIPQLPKDAECGDHEYLYHCSADLQSGQAINITFDPSHRMIVRTAVRAREYQIGDLIVAWGDPTGINQYSGGVFVYWGTRCAVLYTHSFRPESRVEFIQYGLERQPAAPWRGFRPFKKMAHS